MRSLTQIAVRPLRVKYDVVLLPLPLPESNPWWYILVLNFYSFSPQSETLRRTVWFFLLPLSRLELDLSQANWHRKLGWNLVVLHLLFHFFFLFHYFSFKLNHSMYFPFSGWLEKETYYWSDFLHRNYHALVVALLFVLHFNVWPPMLWVQRYSPIVLFT